MLFSFQSSERVTIQDWLSWSENSATPPRLWVQSLHGPVRWEKELEKSNKKPLTCGFR